MGSIPTGGLFWNPREMFIEFCSKCHHKEEYQDPLAADLGVKVRFKRLAGWSSIGGQCGMSDGG